MIIYQTKKVYCVKYAVQLIMDLMGVKESYNSETNCITSGNDFLKLMCDGIFFS